MTRQPKRRLGPIERVLARALVRLHRESAKRGFIDQWIAFLDEQRNEERYASPFLGSLLFWVDVVKDLAVSLLTVLGEGRQFAASRSPNKGPFAMESLVLDLRFATRTLSRRRLFAGVAILTLGLGIGAATAMFSVVDGVLLADSQYQEPDRLMSIWQTVEGRGGYTDGGELRLQHAQYDALREESTAFEEVAVYAAGWGETALSGDSRPELVHVGAATASLASVLGVSPALGRWFLPEEGGEGAGAKAQVTVLSHEVWVGRFAQRREILGSTVVLNDYPHTVVGVLPRGFRLQWLSASLAGADDPGPRDFWVPVGAPGWEATYGSSMWEAVGRLAPGASLEHARAETSRILDDNWDWGTAKAIVLPRTEEEVRGLGAPLLLLFGATGILLLIACGNVAALSLGELQGRAHEVATRAALGADRWRIVRQLITESVLLGIAGSALGASLAVVGTRVLVSMAPAVPRIDLVRVDMSVLAFAAIVGTLSGVLFGLAPALATTRDAARARLGWGGSPRNAGLGTWVLAGEIGLTVLLVVAGALLVQSLGQLVDVPMGFDPENVASIEVAPPNTRYENREVLTAFMNEVLLEMESIPGVTDVSATSALPFPGNPSGWGSRLHQEDTSYVMPAGYNVAPGHLQFMGIPILEGRGLLASDDGESAPVMVVSESLAKALWGDRSPLGQEMIYPANVVTVVGVAGDVRQGDLQNDPGLGFYVPFAQHARGTLRFAVRTRAANTDVLPAMREAMWRVDGDLAITDTGYLEAAIRESASDERYRALLMSVFAVLATGLAAVGIMGVTARRVEQKRREVGIRKALGAGDTALIGGVLGEALRIGAIGIVGGLLGAFWIRPVLGAFLFGVESFDVSTYAWVAVFFLGVCALASYLPGRRLLAVEPVTILRAE